MKRLFIFLLFLLPLCMSCAGGKAIRFEKNPNCRTVIEGFFHDDFEWKGKVPAIITENFNGTATVYGKILEMNEDGILFDAEKENFVSNPGPKKYKFKDLLCVVDANRKIIYGKIPEKYKMVWELDMALINENDPAGKTVRINLKQGEKFAYCMDPGSYAVRKITFKNKKGFTDVSTTIPNLRFKVVQNHVNYIGDLHFDLFPETAPNTCALPYRVVSRPTDGFSFYMFGIAGGLAQAIARSLSDEEVIHTLTVDDAADAKSMINSKLPFIVSPLTFDREPEIQTGPKFETIKVPQSAE